MRRRPTGWLLGCLCAGLATCERAAVDVAPPPQPDWSAVDPAVVTQARLQLQSISDDPSSGTHRARLAMIYQANGMVDLAATCYEQALSLDSDSAPWWYLLAHCRAELGAYDSALDALERVQSRDKSYAPSDWSRGYWLLELGRIDDAEQAFKLAAELQPGAPAVQIGLARIQIARGKYDEAVMSLQAVLQRSPDLAYAHQLLGVAYRSLGRIPDARQALLRSDGLKPRWDDPWLIQVDDHAQSFPRMMQRADALLDAGQFDAAMRILESLRARGGENASLIGKIAEVFIARQDYASAATLLDRGLMMAPDFFALHIHMSVVYEKQGDTQRAIQHADRAISLNPNCAPAHLRRAQIYSGLKDWPAAAESLQMAINLGVTDEPALTAMGQIQCRFGQWQQAVQTLSVVVQRYPASADGWVYLARASAETRRFDQARAALQKAQQLRPDHPEVAKVGDRIAQLQQSSGAPR